MKKWMFLMIGGLMFSGLFVEAQKEVCGTIDQSEILKRLDENKRALKENPSLRSDDILFVPLQFHIVRMDDGSGGIGEDKILEQLCRLNEDYDAVGIHFYLKHDFNYINYTRLYENPKHSFSSNKMTENFVEDAVNIYIVDVIGDNSTGTTLGYYQPNKDWIVVIRSRVHGNTQTLSHEIGHFLSLAHPFNGWENCPYNASEHGNPVNIINLPFSCSGALIELMDGSNCELAADKICDTPPDYNFGITDPEANCSLDFEVKDYNGDVVDVMENNFMSYFFYCNSYQFTPTQIDLMRADFKSSQRAYIRSNYIPDTTVFSDSPPVILSPAQNSTTQFFDHVLLDWEDKPGVSNYLVKVTTGFFTKVESFYLVKNASELLLSNLPPNENNISVLIWPYNEGQSCNSTVSSTLKFKTSGIPVAVNDLDRLVDFHVYPSPVSAAMGQVTIWSDDDYKNASISLVNVEGKRVQEWSTELVTGDNRMDIDPQKFLPGMYVLHIFTGKKAFSKKLLITE